ncbi:AI-2E family transporter [Lacticaseibacillus porcinae]|uniref:AI-2E family transporter n=1 Tax=Lacticaseibacillus porcinae TaxID=1123687 RepID=UPI000F7829E0|nr:AI-2E family transporter [Lacticaseibacillus porcinae]
MNLNRKQLIRIAVIGALFLIGLIYPAQLFGALTHLLAIAKPLILGAAFAYVLNLVCVRIEKRLWPKASSRMALGARRPVALLSSVVVVAVLIGFVMWLVIPQFITALTNFFTSLPHTINLINEWLAKSQQANAVTKQLAAAKIDWSDLQQKALKFLTSGITGIFSSSVSIFTNLAGGIFSFILAFAFALYLVGSKERIAGHLNRVLNAFVPAKPLAYTRYVLRVADDMFSHFIVGQVTEATIVGTLSVIGMSIFRFPNAISIGVLVGMTTLIPMFGAFIGGAIGFVLIAVANPMQGLAFVVYLVIQQQLEGNLIYPRVVGGSIGLPGILVLVAITIGSGLAGILGILIGVPLTATLYRLIKNATLQKEQQI